jgi:NADPH-dependent curcumin reductase CurA
MTRVVRLKRRPEGIPDPNDFELSHEQSGVPGPGQLALEVLWLSLDPYLRGVISGRHLNHGIALGSVLPGSVVGRVLASRTSAFRAGEYVLAEAGWREHAVVDADRAQPIEFGEVPARYALSVLGMPGLTAWAGITQIAKVGTGDVVLVSAASGAVGSVAGQLAKRLGARVVGIAGGAEKCRFLSEVLAFDAVVDYHMPSFEQVLAEALPNGLSVYFDNVGGRVLQAALNNLQLNARIVLCGLIDQYNQSARPPGPNLAPVIAARASMHGLVVYDWSAKRPAFLSELLPLVRAGQVTIREDIAYDLSAAPEHFCRLMQGQNFGKSLVQLRA